MRDEEPARPLLPVTYRCGQLPNTRWGRWASAVVWMGVIFAVSSIGTLPTIDRGLIDRLMHWVGHLSEYGILAVLLLRALGHGQAITRRAIVVTLIVAALYGLSDEWHQSFVKGRSADAWTVGLDLIGALIGCAVCLRRESVSGQ